MSGRAKSGQNSWKKALTSVVKSTKNESAVNQCAVATTGSRDIRRVPEELLGQGPRPGHRLAGPGVVGLAEPVQLGEPADLPDQEVPAEERNREAQRDGHDLDGRHGRESNRD